MRVPHRASKRTEKQNKNRAVPQAVSYRLEEMERRVMLSAALSPAADSAALARTAHLYYRRAVPQSGGPELDTGSSTQEGVITPAQAVAAYGANDIVLNGGVIGTGAGQTIALIDAYDWPTAQSDLAAFDTAFGLPAPPSFRVLNQEGASAPLPPVDPTGPGGDDSEGEEALDVEWAHVFAPQANLILMEGNNFSEQSIFLTAAAAAQIPGVSAISMSFGFDETASDAAFDSTFATPAGHNNVAFLASAGDSGIYERGVDIVSPSYPASSPDVIAVGGTTLSVGGSGSYEGESGWGSGTDSFDSFGDGGGGGGISNVEPQPAYQRLLATQSSTNRTYPDVAINADPESGVAVYDSYDNGAQTPWASTPIGGTSLASPCWAGLIAIADQGRALQGLSTLSTSEALYHLYDLPDVNFHDITTGNNGDQAGVGYDLVTGRGSPVANVLIPNLASTYIGAFAFGDTNINGVQDSGEVGFSGITVKLESAAGNVLQSTVTDGDGLYEFTNIAAGSYIVNFTSPTGYNFSPVGTSTVPTANSNVNPATGSTPVFVVTADAQYDTANAGVFQQSISINDVTVTRPHSGEAAMTFTVTLSPVNFSVTDVTFTTVDGTATVANGDYLPVSGTLVFPVGTTSETITVEAIGNLKIENDVSYDVDISDPPGFFPLKLTGVGTILNSNFPVATVVGPAAQTRSSTVALAYAFVINLSAPAPFTVSVPYTTMDQSAVAGVDYVLATGAATFPAGTITETVDVSVNAGTNRELNKTFLFELTTPPTPITETVGTPSQVTGTILTNALPAVSAVGGSVTESLTGLAYLPFNVVVTPSLSSGITVQYATSDGTAIAGTDYQAESGTLSFGPGQIQQTVNVPVYRQFIPQQTKTLSFTISNSSGIVQVVSPTVTGTIQYLALSTLPFSDTQKAIYTDSLNQRVTVSLRGLGSGNVVFLGSVSNATNAYEITASGTNAASALTVTVAGGKQTTLTDLVVSSAIGSIIARTTNITSTVQVAGGVNALSLGYVSDSTVSIAGAGSGQSVALSFNRVLNSTINSAIPIKSLTANAYINTTGSPIYITAPSVGVVRVKGNFGGTINTASVATLNVGGIIEGGVIASGSIGTILAGGIDNSTFFAGVNPDMAALPTQEGDFSSTTSQIRMIRVSGGLFSNSLIASWNVDDVSVGRVVTSTGAAAFGVSARHVGKLHAIAGSTGQIVQLSNPTQFTKVQNFVVSPI